MLLKPILTGLFLFKAMVAADPITVTRMDGSTQGVSYGVCAATSIQDPQIASIQFNDATTCLLYDDSACNSIPVATLEPIIFNAGSNIRKDDRSELVAHYFTCMRGQ